MSWWKYVGGLSADPAAIPNPASPAPGTPSLMTLGMSRHVPRPARNLPRTCVCQLTPQQEPHRKGAGSAAWQPHYSRRQRGVIFGLRLTNQPGPRACPSGVPTPVRGDSSSPDRPAPGPRPGSAWWALFVSPARCSQADAARVALPPCAARAAQPSTLPPRRLLPPAGQALRCSARVVAGNTQSRRQVSQGDAARGRPCAGNAALGPHAQPA
jgi:hypothetical protein